MIDFLMVVIGCSMPISMVVMFLLLPSLKTNILTLPRMTALVVAGVIIFILALIGLSWTLIFEGFPYLGLAAVIALIVLIPVFNYRYTMSVAIAVKIWIAQICLLMLVPLGLWVFYALVDYLVAV